MITLDDEEWRCEHCKEVIPEGDVYTAHRLVRERWLPEELDELGGQWTQILCSRCSDFRAHGEDPAPPRTVFSNTSSMGYCVRIKDVETRNSVIETLRAIASELEKGPDSMVTGVGVVASGIEGAFRDSGPLMGLYVLRRYSGIPDDLRDGIRVLLDDLDDREWNKEDA